MPGWTLAYYDIIPCYHRTATWVPVWLPEVIHARMPACPPARLPACSPARLPAYPSARDDVPVRYYALVPHAPLSQSSSFLSRAGRLGCSTKAIALFRLIEAVCALGDKHTRNTVTRRGCMSTASISAADFVSGWRAAENELGEQETQRVSTCHSPSLWPSAEGPQLCGMRCAACG